MPPTGRALREFAKHGPAESSVADAKLFRRIIWYRGGGRLDYRLAEESLEFFTRGCGGARRHVRFKDT